MPKLVKVVKPPPCKACGGTGRNSRGGPCIPCVVNGHVDEPPLEIHVNTRGCKKSMTVATAQALARALKEVARQINNRKDER